MCLRWVVAKDEAAARTQAEARFPGQQLELRQVPLVMAWALQIHDAAISAYQAPVQG